MARIVLLLSLIGLVAGDLKLLILHVNDMHARFQSTDANGGICENSDRTKCYGGMPRVAAVAKMKREEAKQRGFETLFLNGGDNFQGTPFYTFYKWRIVAKIINMMGFDVMSFGNHEFDDGVSDVADYIRTVDAPHVCANIDVSPEPSLHTPKLAKSIVLERGGLKIGIIGHLTLDTKMFSSSGKIIFSQEVPAIREESKRLKAQGVHILIALGHSGYNREVDIAREVEEIDAVVGGHSHTYLFTPKDGGPAQQDSDTPVGPYPTIVTQKSGKEVPVVQAHFGTKYLGYIELTFDSNGKLKTFQGEPILLSGDLPEDKNIVAEVQPYAQNMQEAVKRSVGNSNVYLDNDNMKCKLGECNIGNLACDAYVDYVARHMKTPEGKLITLIAVNQAAGIRASIDTTNNNGSITLGDVMTVVPWGKKLFIHTVTGKSLLEALEHSVARYEESIVGYVNVFLQVSGLKITYNLNCPPQRRVVSAQALCTNCDEPAYYPIDPKETYRIIMPQHMSYGGDGYTMLKSITEPIGLPPADYLVLAEYITNHSPVSPSIEGRVTLIGAEEALARGKVQVEEACTHACCKKP